MLKHVQHREYIKQNPSFPIDFVLLFYYFVRGALVTVVSLGKDGMMKATLMKKDIQLNLGLVHSFRGLLHYCHCGTRQCDGRYGAGGSEGFTSSSTGNRK